MRKFLVSVIALQVLASIAIITIAALFFGVFGQ